jgi:hypothetical protein
MKGVKTMARSLLPVSGGGSLIARLCGGYAGPISHHIGTRRRRRLTVLAVYAGYPAMIAAMWGNSSLQRHHAALAARIPVVIALFLAMAILAVGIAVLLARTTINVANLPDRDLDERLRLLRDRAYRTAFRALSGLLILGGFYLVTAYSFGWHPLQSMNALQAAVWGMFIAIITLPTAVVAWDEPDPLDDPGYAGAS